MDQDEIYIKNYLQRQLPAAEMAAAETRYAADPVWAQQVEERRLLLELAELSLRERMRVEARAAERRAVISAGKGAVGLGLGVGGFGRYWAVAAVLVLLLGVGAVWVFRAPLGERLFEAYVQHPTHPGASLGGSPVKEAYRYYDAHDYARALPLLRKIPEDSPEGDEAAFYVAYSQLALDTVDAAIAGFGTYIAQHNASEPLYYEAHWYLGLAYLKAGQVADAKHWLQLLLGMPGGGHRVEIKEILEKLE